MISSALTLLYLLLHNFGVHVRDEADGELAIDLAWDHRLGSCFRKSPLNTMKRQGRVPPAVHEDLLLKDKIWRAEHVRLERTNDAAVWRVEGRNQGPCLGVMQQMFNSNIFAVFIQVKINFLIQLLLFVCQRGHVISQPWNQDLPLPV